MTTDSLTTRLRVYAQKLLADGEIEDMGYFSRACTPEVVTALCDVVEAAKARHEQWTQETYVMIDEALKRLDAIGANK